MDYALATPSGQQAAPQLPSPHTGKDEAPQHPLPSSPKDKEVSQQPLLLSPMDKESSLPTSSPVKVMPLPLSRMTNPPPEQDTIHHQLLITQSTRT
jgi:hypothetical protein